MLYLKSSIHYILLFKDQSRKFNTKNLILQDSFQSQFYIFQILVVSLCLLIKETLMISSSHFIFKFSDDR
jgi:hypothetical protein